MAPSRYARAFPDDLSTLGTHWRRKLKESVSEGASGSFFFRVMQARPLARAPPRPPTAFHGLPSRALLSRVLQSGRHGVVSRFIVKQVESDLPVISP